MLVNILGFPFEPEFVLKELTSIYLLYISSIVDLDRLTRFDL